MAVPLAATVAGVAACTSSTTTQTAPTPPAQPNYVQVVKKLLPSVVQINAGQGTGSGVVYDSHGDIVTNAHVVGDQRTVQILSSASDKPLRAQLVGRFVPDDIAVVKVTNPPGALRPARWANSAQAQVGQSVLAMGAPLGLVDSVTQGIVSATGRTVTGPRVAGQPRVAITDAIQTSAPINPGNSGGALVLLSGAVVGVPTLAPSGEGPGGRAAGIGFAIPSNTVRDIASQLISSGRVTHSGRASLQITGSTHTGFSGGEDGVSVDAAPPHGAAGTAGILAGDVITGLGQSKTDNVDELENALLSYQPGDKVTVHVLRNGVHKVFTVRLGSLGS